MPHVQRLPRPASATCDRDDRHRQQRVIDVGLVDRRVFCGLDFSVIPVVIRERFTVMPSAGSGNLAHVFKTGSSGAAVRQTARSSTRAAQVRRPHRTRWPVWISDHRPPLRSCDGRAVRRAWIVTDLSGARSRKNQASVRTSSARYWRSAAPTARPDHRQGVPS